MRRSSVYGDISPNSFLSLISWVVGVGLEFLIQALNRPSVALPLTCPFHEFSCIEKLDFSDTGTLEEFFGHTTSDVVAIWLMDGATIGSAGVLGGLSSNQDIEQIADTNGDGKAGLIIMNQTTGEVTVLLLNGMTLVGTGSPGTVSTDWEIQD